MMWENNNIKYLVLVLDDEIKKRMTGLCGEVIDLILSETNDLEEQAFVLKILMETFEETQNCVVPFEKRYTEPIFKEQ